MASILSFEDIANIAGVHIKMHTPKFKLVNVHIEDWKMIHFKACDEGILYTNLNDPAMITNPNINFPWRLLLSIHGKTKLGSFYWWRY